MVSYELEGYDDLGFLILILILIVLLISIPKQGKIRIKRAGFSQGRFTVTG